MILGKRRHCIKALILKSYKIYTNLAFIFKISHGKRCNWKKNFYDMTGTNWYPEYISNSYYLKRHTHTQPQIGKGYELSIKQLFDK